MQDSYINPFKSGQIEPFCKDWTREFRFGLRSQFKLNPGTPQVPKFNLEFGQKG